MYLFGSRLIKKYFPDFREPNDTDWVTNDISEIPNNLEELFKNKQEYYFIPCTPNREMTPDEIYTLKVSHAIYDIKWAKTMSDIRFLQIKGCKIIPSFLRELRKHWISVHGFNRNEFNNKKIDNFFNDNVKREVNHDDLHLLLSETPAYKKVVNGVKPIKKKYYKLDEQSKMDVAYEEAFVIAIERYSKLPTLSAYHKAQKVLVTRLHPVWLADEIIKNWSKIYWVATNSNLFEKYKNIKNYD